MSLSDISIRNPVFAWVMMLALMLFGAIAFSRMGISQLPDIDFPVVNIQVTYEGAAPEVMETDVVDVIEDAVMGVEGITTIRSTSFDSNAIITIELEIDRDVDFAIQEVQTRISQAQRLLPTAMDPPVISKVNPDDLPIIWIAVTTEGNLRDLMVYARNYLRDRLLTVPGIADVWLGGYVDRNLRIWVDRHKLNRYELSVLDVINTVQREDIEVPGGLIETPLKQYVVRTMGEADTVREVEALPISFRGGEPVYRPILIREVALVEDGLDDVRAVSRYNGKRAVGLGVIKQRRTNAIAVADRVKAAVAKMRSELPPGYRMTIANDTTRFISESTDDLIFTLILSTILTSLVCFLFLGSFGSTVNIVLAIPTSLLGSFIILYYAGFTLNTFTLMALSLAIGIVVDDAIMVLENITRYLEMGEGRVDAAGHGARQITFAALASTLAIIAIFLPVAFMPGIIGRYFLQFGVTISVAVMLSLFEALTLTPMRASQFLERGGAGRFRRGVSASFGALSRWYGRVLVIALDHRWLFIAVAAAIFTASFLLLGPIKKEFVPPMDQSQFLIRIKTAVGSSIDFTDAQSKRLEGYLASLKEVNGMYAAVGGTSTMGAAVNSGFIFVRLLPLDERPINEKTGKPITQQEVMDKIRRKEADFSDGMSISMQDLSLRGFTSTRGYPVEFIVRGPDWDRLGQYSTDIHRALEDSRILVDVDSDYQIGQPEVHLVPDRAATDRRGVSIGDVGNAVNALIGGEKIAKFTAQGHRYDVRIRLTGGQRNTVEDLRDIFIRNNRGELVLLPDVVGIDQREALLSISRVNRQRAVTLYANPAPGYTQNQALDAAMRISRKILGAGFFADETGAASTSRESFRSLLVALLVGILVSYMILASQFNSWIHPLTVLLALPFSFTGAIIALYATGNSLNMYSFIGLILLMGLVKKNSILLVEFTNEMRADGMPVREALLHACPVRLRPILMTSIATIAAAVPPALAVGPGAESRIPMAVAVLGGMVFSTLLTLVVVPCAYLLFASLERGGYSAGAGDKPRSNR